MNFVTTKENDQALVIPQMRSLKVCWNEDSETETVETVYVVKDDPDKKILVFYLLDETSDGRLGFSGPFKGTFDGHLFPKRIAPDSPILRKPENMNVHRARMDAIVVLLGAV